jgi:hypothetical protein
MSKCLVRDFDDLGRMFFCECKAGHRGSHHRERKSGYPRAYVRDGKLGRTFSSLRKRP